ncbi:ROK family protein [Arthrobacter roseus]|uniref:ROK family protein n=1 Tax=Arthrobacter roseus TaxID=136274 RepID=UPI0019630CA4|nr:ROK family protein [Arthrobacter roseus]
MDVGGTKVAGGVVDQQGRVLSRVELPCPGHDIWAVEDIIVSIVEGLSEQFPVATIGVGAAGWVDLDGSRVLFSPHLAWRDEPLRENLEGLLRRSVHLVNDADATGWAEWRFGSGRSERRLICLTLGTGIGGSLIMNGTVERGRHGVAGEFGHQLIVPGGHQCECGNRGCWEQYASGNALGRDARELASASPRAAASLLEAAGNDAASITGSLVTTLALAGDVVSRKLIEETGRWLGLGLANLAAVLDPGAFVIGGGLARAGDLLLEPARRAFAQQLTGRGYRPAAPIHGAALGPDAGLIGAADLSRNATICSTQTSAPSLLE